jgi:large subunit ribosomal protein L2
MAFVGSTIKRKLRPNLYMSIFEDGFIGFYLKPQELKNGDLVVTSHSALPPKFGNTMPLKFIPVGSLVFNVCGIAKSSGSRIKILRHKPGFTLCKLPSKELKWIETTKLSTLGSLSNPDVKFHKFYKAGQLRWLGRRPITRGVAMNPIDHPHGGGQGKTSGGRPSVSPYSQLTKGYKTVRSVNENIFRTRAQQKSK